MQASNQKLWVGMEVQDKMKFLLLTFLFLTTSFLSAKELKVLMIGNSFSICVGQYLPQVVKSVPGCDLYLGSAYIGASPLDKHWSNIEKAEKDPSFKPYKVETWTFDGKKQKSYKDNVINLLKKEKWDIITLQQASPKRWLGETYHPYGDNLIAYISTRKPFPP